MKKRSILIGCLLFLVLVVVVVAMLLHGVWDLMGAMCGSQLNETVKSPDGKYVAYVYTRDCGATTDYSHHLTVLREGDEFDPDKKGNVLITEGEISVSWQDAAHLAVGNRGASRTFKEETRYQGVTIQYR